MKYRMWISEPIHMDQANLYLVRYHDDGVTQEYYGDGWRGYPMMGVVEPMVTFLGRDYRGDLGALVAQLTESL